jgi:hypothetical protein
MRDLKRQRVLSLGIVASLLGAFSLSGVKQADAQAAPSTSYPSYSAKFVCGPTAHDGDVVRGMYASTINIQNPQLKPVTMIKQAVIALPERDFEAGTVGAQSAPRTETLGPGQAMGVDCKDIRLLFTGTELPRHIEGFLVASVPTATTDVLNVVGKYSARQLLDFKCRKDHDHDSDSEDDHEHGLGPKKGLGHQKCDRHYFYDGAHEGSWKKNGLWRGWSSDVETLDVEEVHPKMVIVEQGDI